MGTNTAQANSTDTVMDAVLGRAKLEYECTGPGIWRIPQLGMQLAAPAPSNRSWTVRSVVGPRFSEFRSMDDALVYVVTEMVMRRKKRG